MAHLIGQQLGNYSLTRLLGQGGFGEVYLGEHLFLKTPAAIKVLRGRMTPEDIEAFIKEAQTIALLKHPHIVRIVDFGLTDNLPFLVMDYAVNGTLRQQHPRGSRLPLSTVLPYLKQIAAALEYAHSQKLVHRDVKPENMLLDANNDILLSDFGIMVTAHRTQSLSTQEAKGTVAYMAPEQIQGMARPASDQYSLAVVTYEWLTGVLPFTGATSIEIGIKHRSEPPPPFQKELQISPQVEQVVLKALAKEPRQRFASVQDFVLALEQAYPPNQPTILPTSPFREVLATPSAATQNPNPTLPPIVSVQQPTIIASSPTNIPSPPLIIQNPTEEQIYQALVAQENPYASWGTLIYDDTQRHMWPQTRYTSYVSSVYRVTSAPPILVQPDAMLSGIQSRESAKKTWGLTNIFGRSPLKKTLLMRNFAFQVQVKLPEPRNTSFGGVIFRSDHDAKAYYRFYIWHYRDFNSSSSLIEHYIRFVFSMKDTDPLDSGEIDASQRNRPNLLAVVVQEATIYLYIDLQLVAKIDDSSLLHEGAIGIIGRADDSSQSVEFSHAKVWLKE